jgi:glycolate oxidase FAD binding subunit
MTRATVISDNLGTIVGPANVTSQPETLRAYHFGGKAPGLAVRPGSEREIAEIVRLAAREKLTLVPVGAGTKLGMNIPVGGYDLALDMTRLDRLVAYDPGDLTLGVEAGLPLSRLARSLAEHRQFLPLAVPFEDRATVGGTIASGMDSPLRQRYGTARDYVLGMEFVTGDGQVAKSGGRVVKNVSGYDLHKLMIGSFGSLGVITRINFRTFPAPRSIGGLLARFESVEDAVAMRHRIAQSSLRPLTLEILSPRAAELCGDRALGIETGIEALTKQPWTLLASFGGGEKTLERYRHDLRALAGSVETISLEEREASTAADCVRQFVPIALRSSPASVIVKMSVLPEQMVQTLNGAAGAAARQHVPWAALAQAVGVIYFALLPTASDEPARLGIDQVCEALFRMAERAGANCTLAWCPDSWRHPRKTGRNDLDQMRRIKGAFDPQGVFAPDPLAVWT